MKKLRSRESKNAFLKNHNHWPIGQSLAPISCLLGILLEVKTPLFVLSMDMLKDYTKASSSKSISILVKRILCDFRKKGSHSSGLIRVGPTKMFLLKYFWIQITLPPTNWYYCGGMEKVVKPSFGSIACTWKESKEFYDPRAPKTFQPTLGQS